MIGFFITLSLLFIGSAPQEAHTGQPEFYLGQNSPGMTPEIFAPGIVSIEEGKEYKITFSPDLREIVFTRRTPRGGNDRLWYCRFEDGKLNKPVPAPFGHDCLELEASFTPDGMRIYFASFRPAPGESAPGRTPNIWFVERAGDSWGEPQLLESRLGEIIPVYLSFEKNGTLYFTNRRPREICTAVLKDGKYTDFKRLPDEINYLPDVAHPAVAPDGSFIIVDSIIERDDRLVGSLYVSFRKPDGSWTRAASMKEALQATDADIYAAPRVTPDGKYIFFERYVRDTDKSDIYWVDARVVDALRP
jgi:Tol biopolymer transport system component